MELAVLLFATACLNAGVYGALRLPHYYSNHMVLQRAPERAILWGYADVIGDLVTVMKNGVQVEETTVQRSNTNASLGIWKLKLPAESNAGPYQIKITSSEGSVSLSDVMFGDVWMCSGQSNMQFKMSEVFNSAQEIDDSIKYNKVRMLFSTLIKSTVPLDDVTVTHPWVYPIKGIIDNFSALCFLFGRELQKHLNYPIGLVESNWGGTPIEVWSSPSAINACPTTTKVNPSPYFPTESGALWNSMIHPYLPMTIKGAIWYQGESNSGRPDLYACQFPAMIEDWRKQFHAASEGETSDQFPFGFVQLAPWRAGDSLIGGFPPTRWAQTTDVGYVPNSNMPNTFMAVAVDLPDYNSSSGAIHPTYKQDVAARLTLGARNVAYGEHDVTFQGPFPTTYTLNPGHKTLDIIFDNGTGTLQTKNNNGFEVLSPIMNVAYGEHDVTFQGPFPTAYTLNTGHKTLDITFNNGTGSLQTKNNKGFEICCASTLSGCSYPTAWQAAPIKTSLQSKIEIDVSGCHGHYHIVGVRYLWRESPCALKHCALYDSQSHLPVPPFIKTEIFKSAESVLVG